MPIRITGLNSGLDTEAIISALVSSYNYKTQKYEKAQTKLSWKQDAWKDLNTKIYSLYTSVGNMRFSKAYDMKSATVSDATKVSVTASAGSVNGSYSIEVESLAKSGYLTGAVLKRADESDTTAITSETTLAELGYNGTDGKIVLNGTEIAVTGTTKISEVVNGLKNAGVNASFDAKNGRFFVSAKSTGTDFSLDGSTQEALKALGLVEDPTVTDGTGAKKIAGSKAVIYVNGAKFESDSNSFSVNGLTINALAETTSEVNVTVGTDTQGIYDKIKDFFTQYNSLINEMTSLYNSESAKGYEPLTDEEKDAMSDTEIEKWEAKIKGSLLRRDDTLSNIMSSMTSAMSKGVQVGNETLYLSNFGIMTLGYLNAPKNEQYAYHIDGDEDDVNTSGNADKLMAAIAEDPNKVMEFMQKLSTNLYTAVDAKMKSTTLSSVYTVYNDKEMASEYSDYTSLIRKWQEKLEQQEEYYYKKFAAMETALSKINSQSSSMAGFFGM